VKINNNCVDRQTDTRVIRKYRTTLTQKEKYRYRKKIAVQFSFAMETRTLSIEQYNH